MKKSRFFSSEKSITATASIGMALKATDDTFVPASEESDFPDILKKRKTISATRTATIIVP
jgi:hypothetical protein